MPYKQEKDDRDENGGAQKVPVGKDPQVRERFAGPKFPHDKRHKGDDGNHRQPADVIGIEPVFVLALVQNGLHRAQPDRQDDEAKGVNAARFEVADVFGIKDELFDHPHGGQTARDVDVENPAPGIILREPAAQRPVPARAPAPRPTHRPPWPRRVWPAENFPSKWPAKSAATRRRRRPAQWRQ